MKFCCIVQDKGERDPLLIKGYWVLSEWHTHTGLVEIKSQLWNHTHRTCFCKSKNLKNREMLLPTRPHTHPFCPLLGLTCLRFYNNQNIPLAPGLALTAEYTCLLCFWFVCFWNHMTSCVAMKMVEIPLGRQVLGADLAFFQGAAAHVGFRECSLLSGWACAPSCLCPGDESKGKFLSRDFKPPHSRCPVCKKWAPSLREAIVHDCETHTHLFFSLLKCPSVHTYMCLCACTHVCAHTDGRFADGTLRHTKSMFADVRVECLPLLDISLNRHHLVESIFIYIFLRPP